MRIARVIGKITLNEKLPDIVPGNLLVVRTYNRGTLAGKNDGNDETLVMYDCLAASEGDLVGLVEGREATAPFWPDKVPYDSYNACLLDTIDFDPILPVESLGGEREVR
ncbi:MAG: carbon dioxide concentrating mechanism protein CcmL [Phycisphaerae bacterium]|nr:carbon dioxide concentrating mechanism protein CcmL [Phycisphaerae bacterium]